MTVTRIFPPSSELCYVEAGGSGGGSNLIGMPSDNSWEDGAADIEGSDTIADAVDKINELLNYLLPTPPGDLNGLESITSSYSGYISNYSGFNTLSPGSLHSYIYNTQTISLRTSEQSTRFSKADLGTLDLYIDGVSSDTFDLAGYFNESERDSGQSYPPASSANSYITITSVVPYNSFPAYQKGNANINLNSTLISSPGDYIIRLEHNYDSNTDSGQLTVVYDDAGRPSISTFNISVDSLQPVGTKYLSGIKYYDETVYWKINTQVSGVFDKTYVLRPVVWNSILHNQHQVQWNDSNASGFSSPPNYDDAWNYDSSVQAEVEVAGDTITGSVYARDPFGNSPVQNFSDSKELFNTYSSTHSTNTHEYFVDEYYRLPQGSYDTVPSPVAGQWDSAAALSNGDLQFYCDKLIYPTQNFSDGSWNPAQDAGRDYSIFSGNQLFFRSFIDNGVPHSSGSLRLRGITWTDINTNVKVEIKLPTQTGWLDLGTDFNSAIFTGADGDGAMTGYSQSGDVLIVDWSSGTFSTSNSGYLYVVRITYLNNTPEISEMWDFE